MNRKSRYKFLTSVLFLLSLTACSAAQKNSEIDRSSTSLSSSQSSAVSPKTLPQKQILMQHGEIPTMEDLQSHRWQYKDDDPDVYVIFTERYIVKLKPVTPKYAWGRTTVIYPYTVEGGLLNIDYGFTGAGEFDQWRLSWDEENNVALTPTLDHPDAVNRTEVLLLRD